MHSSKAKLGRSREPRSNLLYLLGGSLKTILMIREGQVAQSMSHQRTSGKWAGAGVASRELCQVVKEVIDHLDPIGLLSRGCPDDEYAPEIKRIVQRLATAKALSPKMVQTILHETFVEYFDQKLAGPRDRYDDAAREIVRRLSKHV